MSDNVKQALPKAAEKPRHIIINCWNPRYGTGIPADAERHPGGCPDPEYCRGNRRCNWLCVDAGTDQ